MSNLKIDDIAGARPRIRHPTRILVREHQKPFPLATTNNELPDPYFQYNEKKRNREEFNIITNQTKPQNLIKQPQEYLSYQLNPQMYARSEVNINLQPITNIQSLTNQQLLSNIQQLNLSSSRMEHSPIKNQKYAQISKLRGKETQFIHYNRRNEPIVSKEVPVISYDKLRDKMNNKNDPTYQKTFNQENEQLYRLYKHDMKSILKNNYQSKTNRSFITYNSADKTNEKREMQLERSMSAIHPSEKPNDSIFKGLGYDLVTNNNKYPTESEKKYINRISKWFQ